MLFRVNPAGGQPLYLQLMQQVRLAVETGVLKDGDVMPGIRTLAEELAISHNTIAKAYTELAHEGLLELRHGSGAYITAKKRVQSRAEHLRVAQERVQQLIVELRRAGLTDDEILRLCEAELAHGKRSRSA
jgi:GntR family transcriptional regulator